MHTPRLFPGGTFHSQFLPWFARFRFRCFSYAGLKMTRVNFALLLFGLFLTLSAASDTLRADDENVSLLLSVLIMIWCYGPFSVISHFANDPCTVFVLVNALTAQRDSSYHCFCCGNWQSSCLCCHNSGCSLWMNIPSFCFHPFAIGLVRWGNQPMVRFMRKRQTVA